MNDDYLRAPWRVRVLDGKRGATLGERRSASIDGGRLRERKQTVGKVYREWKGHPGLHDQCSTSEPDCAVAHDLTRGAEQTAATGRGLSRRARLNLVGGRRQVVSPVLVN